MVRERIAKGAGFTEIHGHFPKVTQEDFEAFLANEELEYTKKQCQWGKDMRDMNIGVHHLGCRGYPGKEESWEKEDQAYEQAQVENP